MTQAYPLLWPEGWTRTAAGDRTENRRFSTTFIKARSQLFSELDRLGATNAVVSSWLPLRNDGLPRADAAWLLLLSYRTDDPDIDGGKPVPSIHLPRWASRLTLIVETVKVERLQDISEADAIAEGIEPAPPPHPGYRHYGERDGLPGIVAVDSYKALWESLHGAGAWRANPDVVALTFRVVKENIDRIKEAA